MLPRLHLLHTPHFVGSQSSSIVQLSAALSAQHSTASLTLLLPAATVAGIIAKQPVLLAVPPAALKPYAADVLELSAVYEFYTLDWLQQAAKDQQPQRPTSFASIHR